MTMEKDKIYHLAAGFLVSLLLSIIILCTTRNATPLSSGFCGLIAASLAGLGKECYDYFRGTSFDGRDFLVTIIGGFIGSAAFIVFKLFAA